MSEDANNESQVKEPDTRTGALMAYNNINVTD